MFKYTPQVQTGIAVDDGQSIILDVETALDRVYSSLANVRCRQDRFHYLHKFEVLNLIIYEAGEQTSGGITETTGSIHV